jgi:hypothetical protein
MVPMHEHCHPTLSAMESPNHFPHSFSQMLGQYLPLVHARSLSEASSNCSLYEYISNDTKQHVFNSTKHRNKSSQMHIMW